MNAFHRRTIGQGGTPAKPRFGASHNARALVAILCVAATCLLAVAATAQCTSQTLAESPLTDARTRLSILEAIGMAEGQVLVAMHEIPDEEFAAALIQAQQRGIDVYVLTDSSDPSQGAAPPRQMLVDAGIPAAETTQETALAEGFLLIDRRQVITGGRDWFEGTGESESPQVTIIECAATVTRFGEAFRHTASDLLGLGWDLSFASQDVNTQDPCLECLERLNGSTQANFEQCPGIDSRLAFRLEMYEPYPIGSCSRAALITVLLGVPDVDPELADSLIDCLCGDLLD